MANDVTSRTKIGCIWYGCIEAFADLGISVFAVALNEEELASKFYSPASLPASPAAQLIADDSNPELWPAAKIGQATGHSRAMMGMK